MLKPWGTKLTPNVVSATDRRIIIRDPSMPGLPEDIVDIPYDMISSVRIDKGVFSSNIIFKAPGLVNSSHRGKLDRLMMVDKDEIKREQVGASTTKAGLHGFIAENQHKEIIIIDEIDKMPLHQEDLLTMMERAVFTSTKVRNIKTVKANMVNICNIK